jgi:hypothetical protein
MENKISEGLTLMSNDYVQLVPYTFSNKKVEIANRGALRNPNSLDYKLK